MSKIREKLDKIPQSVRASIVFIICNFLVKGISFITLPIFSRILSTSDYGILSIYNSWVSIISLFMTLTIWGGLFNTGLVNKVKSEYEYVSAVQSLGFSIAIVFLIIGFIFQNEIGKLLGINNFLVKCMFVEIFMTISYNVWISYQRYIYRYKMLVLFTIASSILTPFLGYYLVVNNNSCKVEWKVISSVLVQSVIGISLYINNWVKGRTFYDKKVWKLLFKGNVVLIPHYLSMQLLSQSDRIMIGKICGEDDAGIYSIAYTFAMLLTLVSTAVESSYTPYLYESVKNRKVGNVKAICNAVVFFMALICIIFICIIPDVFNLLLPDSYKPALVTIPPVSIGAFYMILYPIFSCIEFYYGDTKYVAITSCVFSIINLILNYIFINMFGFIAAAYTTAICYFGISLTHMIIMRKMLIHYNEFPSLYDIKSIIAISVGFSVIAIILAAFYDISGVRYGLLFILVLIIIYKRKLFFDAFMRIKKGETE